MFLSYFSYPPTINLSIPFSSEEAALMVCDILCVDQELQRSSVQRQISTIDDILIMLVILILTSF